MEPLVGFEPTTIRLQGECSTNWAKVASVPNCPSILWKMNFLSNFFIVIFPFIYFTYTYYSSVYFTRIMYDKKSYYLFHSFTFLAILRFTLMMTKNSRCNNSRCIWISCVCKDFFPLRFDYCMILTSIRGLISITTPRET